MFLKASTQNLYRIILFINYEIFLSEFIDDSII